MENLEVVGVVVFLIFAVVIQVQVDVRRAGVVVLALFAAEVGEVAETRLALAEIELSVLNLCGVLGYGGAAISATQDLSDFFSLDDGKYGRAIRNTPSTASPPKRKL